MFRIHRLLSAALIVVFVGCQSGGSGGSSWLPLAKNSSQPQVERSTAEVVPVSDSRVTDVEPSRNSTAGPAVAQSHLEGLVSAGQIAIRDQRYDDARKAFEDVLDASPGHTTAHHGLAIVGDLTEDWVEAEYHYKQALRNQPRDANLLNDLGYSYLLQNRIHESSRYLNQAVEIEPQHEHAQINLALLSLKQGNRDEAMNRLTTMFPPAAAQQHLARLENQVRDMTVAERPNLSADPALPAPDAPFSEVMQRAAEQRRLAQAAREQRYVDQPDSAAMSPSSEDPRYYADAYGPPPTAPPPAGNVDPRFVSHPGAGIGSQQPSLPSASASPQFGGQWPAQPNLSPSPADAAVYPNSPAAFPQQQAPAGSRQQFAAPDQYSNTQLMYPAPQISPQAMAPTMPTAPLNAPADGVTLRPLGQSVPVYGNRAAASGPANPQNNMSMPGAVDPRQSDYGVGSGLTAPMNSAPRTQSAPGNAYQYGQPGQALQTAAGQPTMPLTGLDTGPGSLFPVNPSPADSFRGMANSTGPALPGTHMSDAAMQQPQVVPPGSGSVLNGAMYPEPPRTLASGQPITTASATQMSPPSAAQQYPTGWVQPSDVNPAAGVSAPGSQSLSAPSPLTDYERQLQQRDAQYQQTLQQLSRSSSAVTPVQAHY